MYDPFKCPVDAEMPKQPWQTCLNMLIYNPKRLYEKLCAHFETPPLRWCFSFLIAHERIWGRNRNRCKFNTIHSQEFRYSIENHYRDVIRCDKMWEPVRQDNVAPPLRWGFSFPISQTQACCVNDEHDKTGPSRSSCSLHSLDYKSSFTRNTENPHEDCHGWIFQYLNYLFHIYLLKVVWIF